MYNYSIYLLLLTLLSCSETQTTTQATQEEKATLAEAHTQVTHSTEKKETIKFCDFMQGTKHADVDIITPSGDAPTFEIEDWTLAQVKALIQEHNQFCTGQLGKSAIVESQLGDFLKNTSFEAEISIAHHPDGKTNKNIVIYGKNIGGWVMIAHGYK